MTAQASNRLFGITLVVLIGFTGYFIKIVSGSGIADPLLISLLLGITIGTILMKKSGRENIAPLRMSTNFFIMPGIIFYSFVNLNFVKMAHYKSGLTAWVVLVLAVYVAVIMALGKILKQKREITYLTATGSAICGASAIALTTPTVKGSSDDVSISLVAVAFVGVMGLFIIFPLLGTMFDLSNREYGIFTGAVLQFTGFVKAAMADIPGLKKAISPNDAVKLAMTIKATRYLGLLFMLPLFGILMKHGKGMSFTLIVFVVAGVAGSIIYKQYPALYTNTLLPLSKPVYGLLWSMAMAAIGLNADAGKLMTDNGIKALIMALAGFFAAILVFLCGRVLGAF